MFSYYLLAWIFYILYFLLKDLYEFGQLGENTGARILQETFLSGLVCLLTQTLWNVLRLGGEVYPIFAFFIYLAVIFYLDEDQDEVSGC